MTYSITATLGPSSAEPETWRQMLSAGATAFRLNSSHLDYETLLRWIENLEAFQQTLPERMPIIVDLQGSKWRLGEFKPFELHEGDHIVLAWEPNTSKPNRLPVPHEEFFWYAAQSSKEIVLDDAKIQLAINDVSVYWIDAVVLRGGVISSRKGITFKNSALRKEELLLNDTIYVSTTKKTIPDSRIALSYVRDGVEMARYREIIGQDTHLIAKIERGTAVEDTLRIVNNCDEIWLCRGDLGAELGLAGMAKAVHDFARLIPAMTALNIPVVLAGQVLEHMTAHATPTRAEICNLYDTLQSGYTGIVLSDETAVGNNPVEACRAAAMFLNAPA